jgi:hypothetical protein
VVVLYGGSFVSTRGLSGGSVPLHPVAVIWCPWAQSGSPRRIMDDLRLAALERSESAIGLVQCNLLQLRCRSAAARLPLGCRSAAAPLPLRCRCGVVECRLGDIGGSASSAASLIH